MMTAFVMIFLFTEKELDLLPVMWVALDSNGCSRLAYLSIPIDKYYEHL